MRSRINAAAGGILLKDVVMGRFFQLMPPQAVYWEFNSAPGIKISSKCLRRW